MLYVPLLGRILISAIFILSGFMKISDPENTLRFTSSVGLHVGVAAAVAVGLVEMIGGVCLLVGCYARAAAWILFAYLTP